MKIIEVISKVKEMPIGTIIVCKKLKAKYELVKDNTGKNKHFRRIKEGKSIPRFSGLIYSDLDFEIVKYCGCCGGELTEKDYSDSMCWECKYGFPDFRILEDKTEEIEEVDWKDVGYVIGKIYKEFRNGFEEGYTSKETNCMSE